jgi:hypothetical protein
VHLLYLRNHPISFLSCVVLHASRCHLADSKPTYLTISCLLYSRSIILWRDSTFLYIQSHPVRVSLSWVTSPGPRVPTWAYRTPTADVAGNVVPLVHGKTHRLVGVGHHFPRGQVQDPGSQPGPVARRRHATPWPGVVGDVVPLVCGKTHRLVGVGCRDWRRVMRGWLIACAVRARSRAVVMLRGIDVYVVACRILCARPQASAPQFRSRRG